MITEGLCVCRICGCKKALTHFSSDGLINWEACPNCRSFFDNDILEEQDDIFWNKIKKDTGFKEK